MIDVIFLSLELIGTAAFAVSGSMVAISRKTDLFGVLFLGGITALGGGVIRDILLGSFPPHAFTNYLFLIVAEVASLLVFLLAYILKNQYFERQRLIETVNNIFDALGLGMFTVTGIKAALAASDGKNAFFVIFLGVTTGIGGGILRDLLSQHMPLVLQKHIYAVASLAGGIVYYIMFINNLNSVISAVIGVMIVFVIRILATVFRWNLPKV